MKKRVLPLLTAVLLLLPSCGTQAGPDLTPLDQAAAEAASFTPGTYENLTFHQDKISVYVPEDLARCTLREVGCFDLDYGDKLMRWWIPDEIWDDQSVSRWDDTYAYAFSSIFDQTGENGNGWYAAVWCTGTVMYARDKGWEHYSHDPGLLDHSCNVNVDDVGEDGPLVEQAERFAADWLAQTDLQTTLRPKYLYVCAGDDGEKFAKVSYQTCWNGVPISDVARQYPDSSTFTLPGPSEENDWTGDVELCSVTACITPDGELDFFGGGHGMVELYEPGAVCKEIVSLSTACDVLSQTVSGYGSQEIRDVALEYRLSITGTDQPEETYRFFNKETGDRLPDRSGVQRYRTSYDLYDATPYWAFYAKDRRDRELIFYVNCLTGDIQILDNQPR